MQHQRNQRDPDEVAEQLKGMFVELNRSTTSKQRYRELLGEVEALTKDNPDALPLLQGSGWFETLWHPEQES